MLEATDNQPGKARLSADSVECLGLIAEKWARQATVGMKVWNQDPRTLNEDQGNASLIRDAFTQN